MTDSLNYLTQSLNRFSSSLYNYERRQAASQFEKQVGDLDLHLFQTLSQARRTGSFNYKEMIDNIESQTQRLGASAPGILGGDASVAISTLRNSHVRMVEEHMEGIMRGNAAANMQIQANLATDTALDMLRGDGDLMEEEDFMSAIAPMALNISNTLNPGKEALVRSNFLRGMKQAYRENRSALIAGRRADNLDSLNLWMVESVNELQQGLNNNSLTSVRDVDNRLTDIRGQLAARGADPALLRRFSNLETSVLAKAENWKEDNIHSSFINNLDLEISAAGMSAYDSADLMRNRILDYSSAQGMNDNQVMALNASAFNQIMPELASIAQDEGQLEQLGVQNQIEEYTGGILEAVNNRQPLPAEDPTEQLTQIVDASGLPEMRKREVMYNDVAKAEMEINAAIRGDRFDDQRQAEQDQWTTLSEELGVVVMQDPSQYMSQFDSARAVMNSFETIHGSDSTRMLSDLQRTARMAQIRGEINHTLDNPETRDQLGDKIDALKATGVFTAIDVDQIATDQASRWKQEKAARSEAMVSTQIQNIQEMSQGEFESWTDGDALTPADKKKLRTAYEGAHNARILTAEFNNNTTNDSYIFGKGKDNDSMIAWLETTNAMQGMVDRPQAYVGAIARAGFLPKDFMDSFWGNAQKEPPAVAAQRLRTLSDIDAINPDVLRNSMDSEQYQAYAAWKYDLSPTPDQAVERLRAYHDPGNAAMRREQQTQYNEYFRDTDNLTNEEIWDELDLEDIPETSVGKTRAAQVYRENVHRAFVEQGLGMRESRRVAKDMVLKEYGHNLDGSLMWLPPERTGVPGSLNEATGRYDHGWIEQDIRDNLPAGEYPSSAAFNLMSDSETQRLYNAGKAPTYLVTYTDSYGVQQLVTETFITPTGATMHRIARYRPELPSSVQDATPSIIDNLRTQRIDEQTTLSP